MGTPLPQNITIGALRRGDEYAWDLSVFPAALKAAPHLGYACLGGQPWFLLPDGSVFELYWLEADSADRGVDEQWPDYAKRSCNEVLSGFKCLVEHTDFNEEVNKLRCLQSSSVDERPRLLFNASFVTELEFSALRAKR
jgi:hypothetical protein